MDRIKNLARAYEPQVGTAPIWPRLHALSQRFARQSVLDSAAATLALNALLNNDQIPIDELTPQMREAFHLAYPHKDLVALAKGGPSDMAGFLSAWRGKLFEVMVRDKLNNGETVATLHLGPGEFARLAESATQPGWDLEIVSKTGHSIAKVQLKATESLAYVHEHVSRYATIPVLVTGDLHGTSHLGVIERVSDIHNDALVTQVQSAADHLHAPQHDDWLVGLPWALIFATETWGIVSGTKTPEQAMTGIVQRSVRTGFWITVAKVASLVHPMVGIGVLAARVIAAFGSKEPIEQELDTKRQEAIQVVVTQLITAPNRLLPYYRLST